MSRSKTSNREGDDALPLTEGSVMRGGSGHERNLRDSIDKVQGALAETELSLNTRLRYANSLCKILRTLTPEAWLDTVRTRKATSFTKPMQS